MRPGPATIEPGTCPGGLVVRTYSLVGELIRESRFAGMVGAENAAYADAEATAEDPRSRAGCVLVVYDGDTGERWGFAEYHAAGLLS